MSWRFLVDEDMPRSTAEALRQAGYRAEDVRDLGLRGHTDQEVFEYAQALRAVLVTADKGFANALRFPPGSHAGIVVVRVPNELPTQEVNRELLRALADLEGRDLNGILVIVEVGRVRVRRGPPRPLK
jgi:predicted nuclease of predicted toxin-antitoxin system